MRFAKVEKLAIALIALLAASPLQAGETSKDALRAQQAALYQQMLNEPANYNAMAQHATVSVHLHDYEAAIATLQRLLIFNRDLPRIRLELGAAHFHLGSYAAAAVYLDQVIADPTAPDEFKELAQKFRTEIDKRTARSAFRGKAQAGITYSTNANLGPAADQVTLFGIPVFLLTPSAQARSDVGAHWLLSVTHTYDLQRPNNDAWVTNFGFYGIRYSAAEAGNSLVARIRTGPRLALTEEYSGPKIRPYVEALYANTADRSTYTAGFVGAELTAPIGGKWSLFSDFNVGYYNFTQRRDRQDETSVRFLGGVAYQPDPDFVLRAALVAENSDAATTFNSSHEIGARFSGEYHYESGFDMADKKWTLSAYVDLRQRNFDAPDPFVAPTITRDEFDLRAGVSHHFALQKGFGIRLDVDTFIRDANIPNFDTNALSVALSAEYNF